jgi:putative hemolysin
MSFSLLSRERRFDELSYACPQDPLLKQAFIRFVEAISGRNYFVDVYDRWKKESYGRSDFVMGDMLGLIDITLHTKGESWPPKNLPDAPIVLMANHPFGIGDGIAICAMAEKLGRPFKVLINNELLKVPEIREYSLPISFEETKEAMAMNMKTRKDAVKFLKEGGTIVVFPAGGVMTAPKTFGRAEDLPWKLFPAKLIQSANAAVIPVFFEGQNGWLFHFVSKFGLMLRTSLFIREFRKLVGKTITAHVGETISYETLDKLDGRQEMTDYLYKAVFSMEDAVRADHKKKWWAI